MFQELGRGRTRSSRNDPPNEESHHSVQEDKWAPSRAESSVFMNSNTSCALSFLHTQHHLSELHHGGSVEKWSCKHTTATILFSPSLKSNFHKNSNFLKKLKTFFSLLLIMSNVSACCRVLLFFSERLVLPCELTGQSIFPTKFVYAADIISIPLSLTPILKGPCSCIFDDRSGLVVSLAWSAEPGWFLILFFPPKSSDDLWEEQSFSKLSRWLARGYWFRKGRLC